MKNNDKQLNKQTNKTTKSITRNKQNRRKMLKSITVGSGAVLAAKVTPDQWSKPVLNSVLLPAHAQMSPQTCDVSGDVLVQSFTDQLNTIGTFPFPGTAPTQILGGGKTLTPQLSVTPGITDSFNLSISTDIMADIFPPADADQTVVPDMTNGALAFNALATDTSFFEITMTLTPENAELCGGEQTFNITFTD